MARGVTSPEQRSGLREAAKACGRNSVQLLFPEGVGEDVDIQAIEDLATEAVRGIVQGLTQELVWKQAVELGSFQPCPTCERSCEVDWVNRSLNTKYGPSLVPEPKCHCPRCKRDFFPSASAVEAGRP